MSEGTTELAPAFVACGDCFDEMCAEIKECLGKIYQEAFAEEDKYKAAGVCRDCGACSLKDAEGKCKPRPLGDTGDCICGGEQLWEEDEEDPNEL